MTERTASVPGNMLGVVGDLLEDITVWRISGGEIRTGTDNPSHIGRGFGGSAGNVARFAARAGAPTRFIGRVGDDDFGERLTGSLERQGIDVRVQRGGRTGRVVVLVDPANGERTMFPDRGAAAYLRDVPERWLEGLGVLHVTSYSFAEEPAATATLRFANQASAAGITVSLDASSTGLIEEMGISRYAELVDAVRPGIFFANAPEAGLLNLDAPPFTEMLTIVKNGPEPTVVRQPDGVRTMIPVHVLGQVRNTTGAGDAFAAGFLAARLQGSDVAGAACAGHDLARSVLTPPRRLAS